MSQRSVVILQARTNSSRLPAKVLLPINGMPIAVLAAKRAANTGREVVIATSCEPSDDALAELAASSGIRCLRGSLDNVLQRFVFALEGYDPDTLVFRLTADNVFPDGALLDEIEEDLIQRGLDYVCCNGERSGLPYGVSAELMRVSHLREAATAAFEAHDLEHVTPYIRRRYGEAYFEKYKSLEKGHYRCTVDCLDDYMALQKIFSGMADEIGVSCFDLINRLDFTEYQPRQKRPVTKMVLGTAQLGMSYGIANQSGKPDQQCAERLIKTAIADGVSFVDTARAYGDSEEVIGEALKLGWLGRVQIITKLAPLYECPPDATPAVLDAFVDSSIYRSCASLKVQRLDVVMLHRATHLVEWGGAVWSRLLELKESGIIQALGVSVQSPKELQNVLATDNVSLIQMPFNVLDARWDDIIPLIEEKKSKGTFLVHVRSAFLQGLLPSKNLDHWNKANVLQPDLLLNWLSAQCHSTRSNTIAEFCLRYVKSLGWVDGVVVGMESLQQLAENLAAFSCEDLTKVQISEIMANRPRLEESTLNPACWSRNNE